MKKTNIIIGCFAACGLAIAGLVDLKKDQPADTFTLTAMVKELQAGSEGCMMRPGANTGVCRQNVSGKEWNCVKSYWHEGNNCISD